MINFVKGSRIYRNYPGSRNYLFIIVDIYRPPLLSRDNILHKDCLEKGQQTYLSLNHGLRSFYDLVKGLQTKLKGKPHVLSSMTKIFLFFQLKISSVWNLSVYSVNRQKFILYEANDRKGTVMNQTSYFTKRGWLKITFTAHLNKCFLLIFQFIQRLERSCSIVYSFIIS